MYCKDKKYVSSGVSKTRKTRKKTCCHVAALACTSCVTRFQKHVKKLVARARQPGEPATVKTLEEAMRGKKGDFP